MTATLRSTLAVALILWCVGTGCIIVSYAHGAMNGADNAGAESARHSLGHTSAMVDGHACCKSHHSSKSKASSRSESFTSLERVTLPEAPSPAGANSCCPLTSGSFVVTTRAQTNDDNGAAAAQTNLHLPSLSNAQSAPLATPLRLPNQNQTYLRCCVFLI